MNVGPEQYPVIVCLLPDCPLNRRVQHKDGPQDPNHPTDGTRAPGCDGQSTLDPGMFFALLSSPFCGPYCALPPSPPPPPPRPRAATAAVFLVPSNTSYLPHFPLLSSKSSSLSSLTLTFFRLSLSSLTLGIRSDLSLQQLPPTTKWRRGAGFLRVVWSIMNGESL